MARLTEACEVFVASLEKAQADLDWVANKLEEEFAQKHSGKHINPLEIVNRIHKLKRELPALIDECSELLQAKQACVDAAKQHLVGNTELLSRLERKAGIISGADRQETFTAFQGAIRQHEEKLTVQYAAAAAANNPIDRDELNQAFVQSVVV